MVAAFQLLLIYSFISLFYVLFIYICMQVCMYFFGQVLELCGRLLWRAFSLYFFFFFMGIFLYIHLNLFLLCCVARSKHVLSLFCFANATLNANTNSMQFSSLLLLYSLFMRRFTFNAML